MFIKRLFLIMLVFCLTVLHVIPCTADPNLPADISEVFSKTSWKDWQIIDSLIYNDTGEAFISIRKDVTNRVAYATKGEKGWRIRWCTYNALPQGDTAMRLVDRTNTQYAGLTLKKAFTFTPDKPGNYESIYEKEGKQWLLREIVFINPDGSLGESFVITDGGVKYNGLQSKTPNLMINGQIQRNLQYFPYNAFPKDIKKLRSKLSMPPSIPAGTLNPQNIKFTGSKKYEVYSGPGENYLRGGNGKAAVSTNDWIQVFGAENGWIMIQYNISKDHMRIGWIPASSLPNGITGVSNLDFKAVTGTATRDTVITDDPLASRSPVLTLHEGSKLNLLATMGDWVYIEILSEEQPVRGFVPVDDVSADQPIG